MWNCESCKNEYNDENHLPCVLPCLHTLCFLCLQNVNHQGNRVVCPCCKKYILFNDIDLMAFPRDFTGKDLHVLSTLLQSNWPKCCEMCAGNSIISYRCKQCEIYICNECMLIHRRVRKLNHHELLAINENQIRESLKNNLDKVSAEVFCKEHKSKSEILRIFCKSCRKPICSVCAVIKHQGHVYSLLSKVYVEEKEKSHHLSSQVQSAISVIQDVMECLTKEQENIKAHANAQRKFIKDTFKIVQDILQKKEEDLMREIDKLCSQKVKILESQSESVKSLTESCKEASLFLEHSLSYDNKPAFLEISQSILRRLHKLLNTSFDSYQHTSATSFRYIKTKELLSFGDVINLLVSITNTEGNVYKCQFSCPSQCFVHEDSKFSIMLVDSNGHVIRDEKVECCVTKDGEDKCTIEGLFSSISNKFEFCCKSKETGIFTLTLYSNKIKIAKENVHIMHKETLKNDEKIKLQHDKNQSEMGLQFEKETKPNPEYSDKKAEGICPIRSVDSKEQPNFERVDKTHASEEKTENTEDTTPEKEVKNNTKRYQGRFTLYMKQKNERKKQEPDVLEDKEMHRNASRDEKDLKKTEDKNVSQKNGCCVV